MSQQVENIDFKRIAQLGLQMAHQILSDVCPGGKVQGHEYTAAGVTGGQGRSFSFNLQFGQWSDFSTKEKGGDVISLYAKARNVRMIDAAKEIQSKYLGHIEDRVSNYPVKNKPKADVMKPPRNASPPAIDHTSQRWVYRDTDGLPIFYVIRGLNIRDGSKFYYPQSFSSEGTWIKRHHPNPTLYNLDKIVAPENKDKWIVVVEGEKAADAAQKLLGGAYVATTWPAGVNNWKKCDWSPLAGRKILFWPDADDADKVTKARPGIECMNKICMSLANSATEIKFIDTNAQTKGGGFDAFDAVAEGWNFQAFKNWALPIIRVMEKPKPAEITFAAKPEVLPPENKSKEVKVEVNIPGPDEMKALPHFATAYGQAGIRMDEKGNFVTNANAVARITIHSLRGIVWRDEFYNCNMTKWNVPEGQPAKVWGEDESVQLLLVLQDKCGLDKANITHVDHAVNYIACMDIRNEPKEWLNSLQWDGIKRVDSFFHNAMEAEDCEWTTVVSKNFWISLVARVLRPGCQVDEMVILESEQGTRKTSALRAIGGRYYGDVNAELKSKDFDQGLCGKILVEFGELSAMKNSEIELVKKKITTTVDQYRPSYGKKVGKFPRTCIFAGTTNEKEYLKDTTGGRRFNPLPVGQSDMKYIEDNRDQLFAEAVARLNAGEPWWEYPQELANEMRESRRETDEWEDIIEQFMESKGGFNVTGADIWTMGIGGSPEKLDKPIQNRMGKILRKLGYKKSKFRFELNGQKKSANGWSKK